MQAIKAECDEAGIQLPTNQQPEAQSTKPSQAAAAVPSDLDAEDIKDPLNINNFVCMSYLDKKISDFFEEQKQSMAKGERPNPVTKKLWQDCMKKKG